MPKHPSKAHKAPKPSETPAKPARSAAARPHAPALSSQPPPSPQRLAPLTSAQIRAARALIRWSAEDLAAATALSVTTIRRAELTESETALTTANDRAIRTALENAGVTFLDQNGGGPGVRLQRPLAKGVTQKER